MINRGGGVSTSKIEEIVRNRLEPYTTEEEVQEIIDARVAGGGAELVNYLSKKEASNTYSKITHGHRDLATVEQVERDYLTKDNAQETYNTITQHNELFNLVESIMTLNFYTKPEIDGMVEALEEEIASGGGEFDPKVLEDYATIEYVDSEIAKIPSGGGGGTASSITNGVGTVRFAPGEEHIVEINSETDGVALRLYNKDLVEMAAIAGGVRDGKHYAAMAVGPNQEFLVVTDGNDGLEMDLGDENKVYCSTDTITITNNLTVEKNLKVDGQVQGTAFEPYATKSYVDEKIAEIPSGGGELDPKVLEDYATIEYVDEKIAEIPGGGELDPKVLEDYATIEYVDEKIAEIPSGGGEYPKDITVDTITLPNNMTITTEPQWKRILIDSSHLQTTGRLCVGSVGTTAPGAFINGDLDIYGNITQHKVANGEEVIDEYATKSYINNEFAAKDHRHERIETITKSIAYDNATNGPWSYYVSYTLYGATLYMTLPISVPLTTRVSITTENCGVIETSLPTEYKLVQLENDRSYEHIGYTDQEEIRTFEYRLTDMAVNGVEISYDVDISEYAPLEHTHDDYYTKEEVDAKIATKDEMTALQTKTSMLVNNNGTLRVNSDVIITGKGHIGILSLESNSNDTTLNVFVRGEQFAAFSTDSGTIFIMKNLNVANAQISKATITKSLTVNGTEITGNTTITHHTNVIGEIGTFCQTNGEIYNGYEKIGQTDCICQVVQAKELTTGIVGIITSEDKFASHGDVLVKVVPGKYELGDILAPTENGYGKLATEDEMLFMMLNAIPRPKITSLQTGIDGMVACFLV